MGFLIFIFALDLQKERNKKQPDFAEEKLKGNYSRKEIRGSRTISRNAKI